MTDVTVLGGGVNGITTALTLRLLGYETRLVTADRVDRAEDPQPELASCWGAGAIHPHAVAMEDLDEVFQDSLAAFEVCRQASVMGVRRQQHLWLSDDDDLPPDEELIDPREIQDPPVDAKAKRSELYMAEMQAYLPRLYHLFEAAGGAVRERRVDREEIGELPGEAVINCTGYWSRDLFDDDALYAVKGHLVRVDDADLPMRDGRITSYVYERSDGPGLYVFPRHDVVFLGGTHLEGRPEPGGEWEGETAEGPMIDIGGTAVPEHIIEANRPILADLGLDLDGHTMHGRVGYRPMREEVRLERDVVDGMPVVHNYGHGGAGITLSWGSAFRAVDRAVEGIEPSGPAPYFWGGDAVGNHLRRLVGEKVD